ncbi:hypothetical protein HQ533_03415 [Candidatus Woesearchaeota archaeon]|nr:hypothetical protein [Candidatus Woesearchaeota archaeon]
MDEALLELVENCPACGERLFPEDVVCSKCGSDI